MQITRLIYANSDFDMIQTVIETCCEREVDYRVGTVFTSDVFYNEDMAVLEDWKNECAVCGDGISLNVLQRTARR